MQGTSEQRGFSKSFRLSIIPVYPSSGVQISLAPDFKRYANIEMRESYNMSIWFQKINKSGVKSNYSATVPLELVLVLIAIISGFFGPRYFGNKTLFIHDLKLLLLVGFAFFLAAKISLFKQNIFNSWGCSKMRPLFKGLYKFGYGLMIFSIILIILLINA